MTLPYHLGYQCLEQWRLLVLAAKERTLSLGLTLLRSYPRRLRNADFFHLKKFLLYTIKYSHTEVKKKKKTSNTRGKKFPKHRGRNTMIRPLSGRQYICPHRRRPSIPAPVLTHWVLLRQFELCINGEYWLCANGRSTVKMCLSFTHWSSTAHPRWEQYTCNWKRCSRKVHQFAV